MGSGLHFVVGTRLERRSSAVGRPATRHVSCSACLPEAPHRPPSQAPAQRTLEYTVSDAGSCNLFQGDTLLHQHMRCQCRRIRLLTYYCMT